MQKHDNLVKLLDGLSLLDEQDHERIISAVDTPDFTDKKTKKESKAQFYKVRAPSRLLSLHIRLALN